jgi:hypothetical protein
MEAADDETRGWLLYESLQGSANTFGVITRLGSTLGYSFNRHFTVDAGVPVYFVNASAGAAANGFSSGTALGNAYVDLQLTLDQPAFNYTSTLTGTAPTGDRSRGFSTGRATVDWNNYFDRPIARLTPFVNAGVANAITDSPFFIRPYTSLGVVTHFEGGATYRLGGHAAVGASVYGILPSGEQTIISRVVPRGETVAAGHDRHNRVFDLVSEAQVPAVDARDYGYSAWFQFTPVSRLDFAAGYSRSASYALDTVFFGIGVNLGASSKRPRHW